MSYYITFYDIRSTEYIFGVKALTSCHSQEFRMEEIRYRHTHTLGLGMSISHLVIMKNKMISPDEFVAVVVRRPSENNFLLHALFQP